MSYEISIMIVNGVPVEMSLIDESGDELETLNTTSEDVSSIIKMFSHKHLKVIDVKSKQNELYKKKQLEEEDDDDYTEEKEIKTAKVTGVKKPQIKLNQVRLESRMTSKPKKQLAVVTKPCKMKIRRGPRKGVSCGKQVFKYGKCPYHWGVWRKANPFMRTPKSY